MGLEQREAIENEGSHDDQQEENDQIRDQAKNKNKKRNKSHKKSKKGSSNKKHRLDEQIEELGFNTNPSAGGSFTNQYCAHKFGSA